MTSFTHRALIFGASGVTGWAVAKEALRYPSTTTFDQVIGLTNRPLTKADSLLPEDGRLRLYSAIDLTAGTSEVTEQLKKIEGIEGVTHVYFSAYTGDQSNQEAIKANVTILQNAVVAVETVCPMFKVWIFQTGGKSYGFAHAGKVSLPVTPLMETTPRIPEPYASKLMYYAQYDLLERLSEGKDWKFIEIRPDALIGFVPSNNAMNLAQSWALFLSFYAFREGSGAGIPYPGPEAAFRAAHTSVSQDTLARFSIFASLHPDVPNGDTINIGDQDMPGTWAQLWPGLTSYFSLVGTGPDPSFTIAGYMEEHRGEWPVWVAEKGLRKGALEATDFKFTTVMTSLAIIDRHYDLSKARSMGWSETKNRIEGFYEAFELMRRAKIIP